MTLGCLLAMVGFGAYSHVKLRSFKEQAKLSSSGLPKAGAGGSGGGGGSVEQEPLISKRSEA
jgi:hypothetical protein